MMKKYIYIEKRFTNLHTFVNQCKQPSKCSKMAISSCQYILHAGAFFTTFVKCCMSHKLSSYVLCFSPVEVWRGRGSNKAPWPGWVSSQGTHGGAARHKCCFELTKGPYIHGLTETPFNTKAQAPRHPWVRKRVQNALMWLNWLSQHIFRPTLAVPTWTCSEVTFFTS